MSENLQPFEYGISRILDCGFMIEEGLNPVNGIHIGHGMTFVFDVENNWIQFLVKVEFYEIDTNRVFMSGTVLTRFAINNLKSFTNEDNKIDFPMGALEHLFGISYGHLRAILSKNVAGSKFSSIYSPIVNPVKLFNELLQYNIQKLNEQQLRQEDRQNIPNIDLAHSASKESDNAIDDILQKSREQVKRLSDATKKAKALQHKSENPKLTEDEFEQFAKSKSWDIKQIQVKTDKQ